MQSLSYTKCGNTVSSNHAMAFHLSMLLTVKLFILPFEKDVNLATLKAFQLSAHHQIVVIMVLLASMSAIFVFATRREDSNTYSYWGGFNITYVLLSTLHMCWAVVFVSFGMDAIKFYRREGNFQRKMPWWNRFVATTNHLEIGPIYRWLMVVPMTYLPIQSLGELIVDGNKKGSWRYTSGSILFFHLSLAALYICSMPRKKGFPWSELAVYALAPLSLIFKIVFELRSSANTQVSEGSAAGVLRAAASSPTFNSTSQYCPLLHSPSPSPPAPPAQLQSCRAKLWSGSPGDLLADHHASSKASGEPPGRSPGGPHGAHIFGCDCLPFADPVRFS